MPGKWKTALLLVFCAVLLPHEGTSQTASQKKKRKPPSSSPKKVMISFDEDLVEGSLTGTELFMIMQKKQNQLGDLFELRENFIPEMYENVEAVH